MLNYEELQAMVLDATKRAELLDVAKAIFTARIPIGSSTPEQAVAEARELIEAVNGSIEIDGFPCTEFDVEEVEDDEEPEEDDPEDEDEEDDPDPWGDEDDWLDPEDDEDEDEDEEVSTLPWVTPPSGGFRFDDDADDYDPSRHRNGILKRSRMMTAVARPFSLNVRPVHRPCPLFLGETHRFPCIQSEGHESRDRKLPCHNTRYALKPGGVPLHPVATQ